ncbi:hypothetical protein ACLMJK_003766 [Lecanora helva]
MPEHALVAPPTLTSIPPNVPSRGPQLNGVYIGMIVPATVFVAVRLVWKYCQPKGLGLDDLCIFIAIVLDFVHTGLGIATVQYGFGHHAVDIPRPDYRKAIMLWYVCQIIYKMLVGFTKLAILFLYLRLFPQQWLRQSCWVTGTIVFVGSLAFAIASIFECNPIHKLWDRKQPGTCFNIGASWYAYAAFNALADIVIIVLPMVPIWKLQLRWPQKAAIAGVFLTGAFVCFTSIMRIVSLPASAKSHEPTCKPPITHPPPPSTDTQVGGSVDAVTWAEIEGGVGIICACLPALRAPFVKAYRRVFGSVTGRSTHNRNYNEFHNDTDGTAVSHSHHGGHVSKRDYWEDGIPLSTSRAQRDESEESGERVSEEKVLGGIVKTVDVRITR